RSALPFHRRPTGTLNVVRDLAGRQEGEPEGEGGPPPDFALEFEAPAERPRQERGEGEPDPRPFALLREPAKFLEGLRPILGRDPPPRVRYVHPQPRLSVVDELRPHEDPPPLGVLDRVREQVAQDLPDPPPIGDEGWKHPTGVDQE